MERRELLKNIGLATGAVFIGGEFFLTGCKAEPKVATDILGWSEKDKALLSEIAETILPKTNTPGAKDARLADFMTIMVDDCYTTDQQKIFKEGMKELNDQSQTKFKKSFVEITGEQRTDLLNQLNQAAIEHQKKLNANKPASSVIMNVDTATYAKKSADTQPHYFTLMKQLTLLGFFTSKEGSTEVLRHVAVPGKYEACIPYKKGDRAWAIS